MTATTLRVGSRSNLLVGVMPSDFAFPDSGVAIWVPTAYLPFVLNRRNAWYTTYGRLKPGVTLDEARANLGLVQAAARGSVPDTDRDLSVQVMPLKDMMCSSPHVLVRRRSDQNYGVRLKSNINPNRD